MAEVKVAAVERERTGKGPARQARRDGKVPGTLYGHGKAPLSIQVDRRELITAFHTDAGMNVLLDLQIDGRSTLAIARDLQRDPVRGTLMHADFLQVSRTEKVEAEVPIHLVGESPGAKEGGIVEQPLFAAQVRATVTSVPDEILADISGLNLGDSLRVADLPGGDYEFVTEAEEVVVSIATPISEEELEALEAEAGVEQEEPEAVAEEGEEAAAEEGEEPEAEGAEEGEEAE
ncbi:MAG: 50S ribosomal protein L25 [Actinomycetota bacterium]